MRLVRAFLVAPCCILSLLAVGFATKAQNGNSSSINGAVSDPSGAVVANATVTIHNAVSGYDRSAVTDNSGNFSFPNVPFNPYHLTVMAPGFANYAQDVEIRSTVPQNVKINLSLGQATASVTVEAAGDLVETEPTAHTDIDRQLFNQVPLESSSSSISSLVTLASPGVAADSNGLFHGLGDHAENSFSVDGQPITDQQSKVFSNQLPMEAVQSMEVIEGAPPAEYGDKTSLVIDVTTRSGQGVTPAHGSVTAEYGSFGSVNGGFDLAYGGPQWGNFIAVNGMNSGRFLDGPEFAVMHDKGNQQNVWDRIDYQLSSADSVHMNLNFTRSWFQTPNSFDSQLATPWSGVVVDNHGLDPTGKLVGRADQRSQIRTFNIAPSWTRVINSSLVFTAGVFVRHDQYNYYPSGNPFADLGPTSLQRETVSQLRMLTNAGGRASVSYVKGVNNLKVGIEYSRTTLVENDHIGIVDPTFNPVCDAADGSVVTNPLITDPATCGSFGDTPDRTFDPLLGCYDLTRTAPLPASDGCPAGQTRSMIYSPQLPRTNVKELSLYVQDAITKGNWNFNLGIRGDVYKGLTSAQQAEPRLGVAYNIKPSSTVVRLSYARTLETPFNENLILSSVGCNNSVLSPLLLCTAGANSLLSPGFRNEFHAGLNQAFGKHFVIDGEYIWKYTHNAYDFSVLGNTPITFPIEWHNSKIPGFAIRGDVTNIRGFTAYVVMSSVAARFFTPQIGGAGAAPSGVSVFRIDHDERYNETTHLQYQPSQRGPWLGFNWRYDSGLVAGSLPCAGGNCANGPEGTDTTIVDLSRISADQQFEAGLFCGSVRAAPPTPANPVGTPISSALGANLCPANQYRSSLVEIPAPGTERDDRNPPRIAPRSLFDLAVGHDNIFHGDRFKWSVRITVINLANQYALYNFLSTFSGTHYVTPRSMTGQIGFHF
jgi:Carboxypeptidase regulatory-like domain/TonB-dependent Receptor Plug Domain